MTHSASDIVDRLRAEANSCRDVCEALETANCMQDAADEIERLRGGVARWLSARRAMFAGAKPWSSELLAAMGLAEAALAQTIEPIEPAEPPKKEKTK